MRFRITLLLTPLIFTGCFQFTEISRDSSVETRETEQGAVVQEATITREPHPVSLEAFSEKAFDGADFTVGHTLATTASYTRYYITYTSAGLKISGIMNVPKGDGPFPVLFLNHGYIDPDIYTNGRGLKREQDYLAQRGYVVVHSDYRNHADSDDDPDSEVRFRLGYAEDVINGILALRKAGLSYVDGEKIGMLGHSMGGGVTLQILTTQPDLVDAAVLFAPVSGDARDNFERWTTTRPEVAEKIRAIYGSPEENPDFWDGISPIEHLQAIQTPILNHHGTADDSVPLEWSERLQAKLRAAGKDSTLYVYYGQPHEFTSDWPLVMRRTVDFFDQYLK